ncbi:hypothetical protein BC628DRAFT_1317919 [Trametes gibbosa]|nr:hypothetical protein BC628DRAFT_1317919 [Trametes gibbosa]
MQVETTPAPDADAGDDIPATGAASNKKRPRIDMAVEPRERKRGKTMFGLVLNTLAKAKTEDKQRNASEAAKKRQSIEQRLQDKLRKETDSIRRAGEAKRDKVNANRKEEDLQLKDSIHKLRRIRLPLLSNFLLTSDVIPFNDSDVSPSKNPLAPAPRMRPPPLYYLPAKLLPSQEGFLRRRKAEVTEAAEKEWEAFRIERSTGVESILKLRQRVAEEEGRHEAEFGGDKPTADSMPDQDNATMAVEGEEKPSAPITLDLSSPAAAKLGETRMDADEGATEKASELQSTGMKGDGAIEGVTGTDTKAEAASTPARGEEDDAVEY